MRPTQERTRREPGALLDVHTSATTRADGPRISTTEGEAMRTRREIEGQTLDLDKRAARLRLRARECDDAGRREAYATYASELEAASHALMWALGMRDEIQI